MFLSIRVLGFWAAIARAAQPGAREPIEAPIRDLPWGQLNILHTTDTHGWHAGHLQEPAYQADWGDYISLATHLHKRAAERKVDLLVVDTGDRVEGSGLYDASFPPGRYTYDVFQHQQMDVICSGNHELYHADTATREWTITTKNFKDSYLASNLDIVNPDDGQRVPLAARYRLFETVNQKLKILAFGFIFDFKQGANNSFVQPIHQTIKEQWFQDAIREECDVILVIGHVPVRDSEYDELYKAIRKVKWDTPIQFIGGHTHIRDYVKYGDKAFGLESGRYMETIGWASIDGLNKTLKFNRKYIDNNLISYYHHTGLNKTTFPTSKGTNVTKMIELARKNLKLDEKYGCAPQDYWVNRAAYPSNGSIFTLLETQVLPQIATGDKASRLFFMNTGAIRFELFKGAVTTDTIFSVSPFTGGMSIIKDVPYDKAKRVLDILNKAKNIFSLAAKRPESKPHLLPHEQKPLSEVPLQAGYTTKDDLGTDGDDTEHVSLEFFSVPNCIQAEIDFPNGDKKPEKVDVVFLSFIQPWILKALLLTGQEYKESEVGVFMEGVSFTGLLTRWINDTWSNSSC